MDQPQRMEPQRHTRPQRPRNHPQTRARPGRQTPRSDLPNTHRVPPTTHPTQVTNWKVCPRPGCPHLVAPGTPCPTHPPPDRNKQSWTTGRDLPSHQRLKRRVLKERPNRCERCKKPFGPKGKGSHLHHDRKGDLPENVRLLCEDCHIAVDPRARRTPKRP